MEHGTTLLLDLPGVSVLRVVAEAGGGRVVHLATQDEMAAACPSCGVFSTSVKQRRTTAPRDLPYGLSGLRLVWHKRRMRCREVLCSRGSFTESIEQIPARARVTGRCRDQMARSVGDDNHSVSEVAALHGVSWPTAHRAVVGYGLVFCSSGRAGPTLAIKPGGIGDVTTSHIAWQTERGSPFVPSPLLYRDQLYTINDMASVVTSFDARSGKVLWQGRLGVARREGFSASPVAVDGKIFFTNDDGETFVLRDAATFELLHVNRIGERTIASPALVEGRWYIRTDQHLFAIGR